MLSAEQKEALAAPLARAHVKERKQAGRQLSYIEGWVAISEANRIFGFDGWTRETVRLEETNRELVELVNSDGEAYRQWRVGYLAKVRVVVDGIVREGTGFGSGMARPEALGDAVESAAKEAETDAMKRALMTFGNPFGLALYDKTQENVEGSGTSRGSDAAPQKNGAGRIAQADARGIRRLTSSQAIARGLGEKIKDDIWACQTLRDLEDWEADFVTHTAECPVAWLDGIRNDLILRAEEIRADAKHASLDNEYRAVVA